MADFLTDCVDGFAAASTEEERVDAYFSACEKHSLRGAPIFSDVLPDRMIRFCGSVTLLEIALKRMVGDAAVVQLTQKRMSIPEAEDKVLKNWDPTRFRATDRLARGGTVFATPYSPHHASLDAYTLADSLGLPCATPDGVIRSRYVTACEYHTSEASNLRFPTVADAQTFPGFRPAPEIAPDRSKPDTCFGWTNPVRKGTPQREIVHENLSLDVAISPIRFVGWFEA
jgi:hypothetical protein